MNEFDKLYEAYKDKVFNLALQYVQNLHDAEEITQDIFVKIYRNLDKFRNNAQPQTWIYRIAVNQCLDFLKAKRTRKRFAFFASFFGQSDKNNNLADNLSDFNHPGIDLEQKESIKIIFQCLNELPDNQKTALILHKIEHKPQAEIAEIMQISIKAVESLIQRAKTNLQKKLSQNKGLT